MKLRISGAVTLGLVLSAPMSAHANVCVHKALKVRRIMGMVVDPDGRPISGAKVTVILHEPVSEQNSDPDGSFAFDSLKTGTYEVRVSAKGFATAGYFVTLHRPNASYKRVLRIRLLVGGEVCSDDDFTLAKSNVQIPIAR